MDFHGIPPPRKAQRPLSREDVPQPALTGPCSAAVLPPFHPQCCRAEQLGSVRRGNAIPQGCCSHKNRSRAAGNACQGRARGTRSTGVKKTISKKRQKCPGFLPHFQHSWVPGAVTPQLLPAGTGVSARNLLHPANPSRQFHGKGVSPDHSCGSKDSCRDTLASPACV